MANFLETTRNKLRALTSANPGTEIGPGFAALANDVDTKMTSWWEDTFAKRPAAGQANRLFKASDTGAVYHDTGTAYEALYVPGDLKLSAASSVPDGWLTCEGQAVSRTTFANLFAAIGVGYGEGNGTTTFNVPDFRGRSPLGAGSGSGLTTRTRGQTLGSENLQEHTHTFQGEQNAGAGGEVVPAFAKNTVLDSTFWTTAASGTGHSQNMQPSTVCNVWIKT